MGFCDLCKFNIALLAKQGWYFLTKSNTLVVRIFKSKYYPNTTFWNALLGTYPSYMWRSIFAAKKLLEDEVDLIDTNTKTWNMELIARVFNVEDAEAIKCISLSHSIDEDKLTWKGNNSGKYSVKSGYRTFNKQTDPNAIAQNRSALYKKLWALNIPSKIKIATWKFLNNFIPIAYNLYNRKISSSPICPPCGLLP
ncbi:Ribonuclease H-like superfamily protein [Gossypium australe]|uniref:Ribonuclease H-like superfamily protein n=1 Tax=Gossypium australe TaxID=47621 RepID=A0A5B6V414_9ROSI|nr:Ribonuclease H-like superfamily protein [Gossypium australe]